MASAEECTLKYRYVNEKNIKKDPSSAQMRRGRAERVVRLAFATGVVDRPLQRPRVYYERDDGLAERDDEQREEFGVSEYPETALAGRGEHKEDQVEHKDAPHPDRFVGVVDTRLAHSHQFEERDDCAEDQQDLNPRQSVGSEGKEGCADVVDANGDNDVKDEEVEESRQEPENFLDLSISRPLVVRNCSSAAEDVWLCIVGHPNLPRWMWVL